MSMNFSLRRKDNMKQLITTEEKDYNQLYMTND